MYLSLIDVHQMVDGLCSSDMLCPSQWVTGEVIASVSAKDDCKVVQKRLILYDVLVFFPLATTRHIHTHTHTH